MRRKLLRVGVGLLFLTLIAGGLGLYLWEKAGQRVEAPTPPIEADRSPAGVARGELIFRNACVGCHLSPEGQHAAGGPLPDVPKAFGSFFARNLTSHPTAGIGRMRDQDIARVIRYGVLPEGRQSLMPSFAMSDADLAALLGFLRSPSPLFEADPREEPRSQPTPLGRLVLYLSKGNDAPKLPAFGLLAPPIGPTAEYGRYLAHSLYGCADCHTPGYAEDKTKGPGLMSGGEEFQTRDGESVYSSNLTPDATGLYLWTYEDFVQALRFSARPDGTSLRSPMPRFDTLPEVELRALWAYLSELPRRQNEVPGAHPIDWAHRRRPPPVLSAASRMPPALPAAPPVKSSGSQLKLPPPPQLFVQLGCKACHGKGMLYHEQFAAGRSKDLEYLARWIRNAPSIKPGTPMPVFASVLSEEKALEMANWVKSTSPDKLP